MNRLTMRFMIATAALVVVAGVASAQTLTAQIPFEFRVGNRVMTPGTYQIDSLRAVTNTPVFRLWNVDSGGSIALLPQAPVEPQKGWEEGNPKLLFACTSGHCALAQLWSGAESYAYQFANPKLGNGEDAYLRVIPMQAGKGE